MLKNAVDAKMGMVGSTVPDVSVRDLTSRLYSERKSYRYYAWYTLIAVVALLDFLAKVVADYIREEQAEEENFAEKNPFGFHLKRHRKLLQELKDEPFIVDFIHFLDKYSIGISLIFSLLWFIDAFVMANTRRSKLLHELDRKHLLDGTKTKDEIKEVKGAWGTFYRTLVVQCLLLPISFFIIAHHLVADDYSANEILLDDDEKLQFNFQNNDGKIDEVHSFSTHLSQSVVLVLGQYMGTVFVRQTGMQVKATIKKRVTRFGKKMAFFAVRNPRRFAHRMRKALRLVRWLKYLAPLIGASNKLRGNTIDLIKKYKQRRMAAKIERARILLFKSRLSQLPPEELKKEAAIMVQRAYRRRQAAKATRALKLIQGNKEQWAAQRMQHIFRAKLKRIRARLLNKKNELNALRKKQHLMEKHRETMSTEERRRMYKLQDELGSEASHLLNKRMLMRPNTRFAVTWKILFVFCVFFEISQIALAPTLATYIDEQSGVKLDIGKVLELNLVPDPVAEWKQCGAVHVPIARHIVKRGPPLIQWIKKIGRKAQEDTLHEVEDEEERKAKELLTPWYCHKPYSTAQGLYIQFLKIAIHEFLVFVGLVCFLDVFVTFFTGELHPDNGNLVPKPFFARWLLPGIVLQLLVNPQMVTVSKWVGFFLEYAHHVGHIRVYRWTAAFFYPVFSVLAHYLIDEVWRPLVKENNNHTLESDPFAADKQTVDRRAIMQQLKPTRPQLSKLTTRRSLRVIKLSEQME